MLRGSLVTLRPLRPEEFELMRDAHARLSPFDPPDETTDRRLRERIEHSGRLVDGLFDLGIEADGRLVGDVGARCGRGVLPPGVFEFGIEIYEETDRGKGYGADAVRILTSHLRERLGAERVQASTAVDNVAMRRLLERLGYREEGILRGYMPSPDGGRDDYVLYGLATTIAP